MRLHYLKNLFQPNSIALIGASKRSHSVGEKVCKNLLSGGYQGKFFPINPKYDCIMGKKCESSILNIQDTVDLAIIITPARIVPQVLEECGLQGVKMAIILSAGFSEIGQAGKELEQQLLNITRRYGLRIVGPNCLGVMQTHLKMNATFDNNFALAGDIAFVSQSGAISAAILDWSIDKQIGYSIIASLGNCVDIEFADVLDYLATDPYTKSILLYIEGIRNARHFMSSLRAAARIKPVIVIKAGRRSQGARAALSHTGALIGDDDVFDTAIRRAGAVRVNTIEELFSATEILASNYRVKGNKLIIITNGGGAGVMAADRANDLKITLPKLDNYLLDALNKVLPPHWSHQNPIDIIGDADPNRYESTLDLCLKSNLCNAILTILVPVAMSNPKEVAKHLINKINKDTLPVLTCWMGEKQVKSSWRLFAKNKVPYFNTPEKAVEAFSYLADYHLNQQFLMQIPIHSISTPIFKIEDARKIIVSALKNRRNILTTIESKSILNLFTIPVIMPINVTSKEQAIQVANEIQYPIVMKINSEEITHKQDVGGVVLNVTDDDELHQAYTQILRNVSIHKPDAKILGVTVEPMIINKNNREIMIGVFRDKVFGPVISFGLGGSYVEIFHDRSLSLPPLNRFLAKAMIADSKAAKILANFRNLAPVNLDHVIDILLCVSEIISELPQIKEMDINPIVVNQDEISVLDARIIVDDSVKDETPYSHLAIHPYPHYLTTQHKIMNESIIIRPIRPEDAELEQGFINNLSNQSKYYRFFETMNSLSESMLVKFTQIDYDREMALVAVIKSNNKETIIGIARYIINSDLETCEFAIVIADNWQKRGLGYLLLKSLIEAAKTKQLKEMIGIVLTNNTGMITLAKKLDFVVSKNADKSMILITKKLC